MSNHVFEKGAFQDEGSNFSARACFRRGEEAEEGPPDSAGRYSSHARGLEPLRVRTPRLLPAG